MPAVALATATPGVGDGVHVIGRHTDGSGTVARLGAIDQDGAEVGGRRHHRLLYTCWNDGAGNYVDASWSYFTCWKCGALNYT